MGFISILLTIYRARGFIKIIKGVPLTTGKKDSIRGH